MGCERRRTLDWFGVLHIVASSLLLVAMPFAPSSILVPSSTARSPVRSVLAPLVAMPGAPSSVLVPTAHVPILLGKAMLLMVMRLYGVWARSSGEPIQK